MPVRVGVYIAVPCAVSHVDPHTHSSLWYVLAVPFNMADTEGVSVSANGFHVDNSLNRHWTTALSAIERKEPTLATAVAVVDSKSARVEDT